MYNLPLFPLNTVLFPGVPLYLHIFEPRYRLLLQHCIEGNLSFGVVLIRQGVEALGPLALTYSIGCSARLVEVEPLEDGRSNLTVIGDERFRVISLDRESQPYLVGHVETLQLEHTNSIEVRRNLRPLYRQVKQYLGLLATLENADLNLDEMMLPEEVPSLIYLAASLLQIPVNEKQPLLATENASLLIRLVQRLYRREMSVLSRLQFMNEEQAQRAAWLN